MIRIKNIRLEPGYCEADARAAIAEKLGADVSKIKSVVTVKRSIDARNRSDVHYLAVFDVEIEDEKRYYSRRDVGRTENYEYDYPPVYQKNTRPVVVGAGPAGLFCALILAYRGANPIVIERGKPVEERIKSIEEFNRGGRLDLESNVQFGEGGAGTFSDGKLNTGTKDPRQRKVLLEMCEAGAPKEILYEAKPHVGTDKLRIMLPNIRKKIISLGGGFIFDCKLTDIIVKDGAVRGAVTSKGEIETDAIVLAAGHSARDTFEMLYKKGVIMERKPFSAGVRIEHRREMINAAQYGKFAPLMPSADYKCAHHMEDGRGVYTFCMCPGGTVCAAASEEEGVVVNGMSNFSRMGDNSNSAVLVSLYPTDFDGTHPLEGMYFQRKLERAAFFQAGADYSAPAQRAGDFFENRRTAAFKNIYPSYERGVIPSNLKRILPGFISSGIEQAVHAFGRKIKGFDSPDAVLTGVETRSSSPVRIIRDENFSSSIKGLYPCGEGAGYAGGIMSAAVDGIKVAEQLGNEE